jgi:EAL domain-containing protein (putative c-di-GMP-specific phosphodiesterase class I)
MRVADEAGLAPDIGRWALEQGCHDVLAVQDLQPGLQLRLNLSARLLEHPALIDMASAALGSSGLAPAHLRLELPESAIVDQPELAAGVVQSLVDLGVQVSVDDLGSGVSSLAWLSTSPVDEVKLVAGVFASRGLVRGTLALGQSLRLSVATQGLSRLEEAANLSALGVRSAQGPLYGPPMPLAELQVWLAERPPRLLAA